MSFSALWNLQLTYQVPKFADCNTAVMNLGCYGDKLPEINK